MISDLAEQFPFPQVIDNTMMDAWKTCPHQFFRGHIQGLKLALPGEPGTEPVFKKSIHLHYGGCLARGLEVTRKAWYAGASEMEAIGRGGQAIMNMWDLEQDLPAPRTRTEEVKTLDSCLLAHVGYFREWPLDDPMYQCARVGQDPLVENSGARAIPGTAHPVTQEPILYAGRFDVVLDRGSYWGLDDKTTGGQVEGDRWAQQWRLRGQFTGYSWLAQAWGYDIRDWLIHGIQPLKTKCNFAEAVEVRPKWMIERWAGQLTFDVNSMVDQYNDFLGMLNLVEKHGKEVFEMPGHPFSQRFSNACHHYNQPCAFMPLCSEPHPDDFLDSYVVHRWNPLERSVDE